MEIKSGDGAKLKKEKEPNFKKEGKPHLEERKRTQTKEKRRTPNGRKKRNSKEEENEPKIKDKKRTPNRFKKKISLDIYHLAGTTTTSPASRHIEAFLLKFIFEILIYSNSFFISNFSFCCKNHKIFLQ